MVIVIDLLRMIVNPHEYDGNIRSKFDSLLLDRRKQLGEIDNQKKHE